MTIRTKPTKLEYRCTRCRSEQSRANLVAKRVQYMTLGERGRVLRSRIIDWLCPTCLLQDEEYHREKLSASPGMAHTKLAR